VGYPVAGADSARAVAVDALGRLWLGDRSGLYRQEAGQWRPIPYDFGDSQGACDLTPAADGTMFAQSPDGQDCQNPLQVVLRVPPDGAGGVAEFVGTLAEDAPHLVRSASRRNRLWTVAPDGAIWYTTSYGPDDAQQVRQLQRRDPRGGLTAWSLPFRRQAVRSLEVDANNHVWVVAGQALWRLSARPDFGLRNHALLLAPGSSRRQQLQVASAGGFRGEVSLALHNLPAALSGQIEPVTVRAGDSFTLTISAGAEVEPGVYTGELQGASGEITHTSGITVVIANAVVDGFLPLVAD
jgi:ligand-binding sensor domain-containing protein